MIVIGTTGSNPKTVVPARMRSMTVTPLMVSTGTAVPGAGAGVTFCMIATLRTAATVQTVEARAPQRVLPFQKIAAISSGASAEYPANAYCVARSKIDWG